MNWAPLISAARDARLFAHAPYSNYPVGSALVDDRDQVWTGCNVENVSYGLSLCAERTAIVKMVSAGARLWKRIAVVTRDGGTPCGACLQVLAEFAGPEAAVAVCSDAGDPRVFMFKELFPHGFTSAEL